MMEKVWESLSYSLTKANIKSVGQVVSVYPVCQVTLHIITTHPKANWPIMIHDNKKNIFFLTELCIFCLSNI